MEIKRNYSRTVKQQERFLCEYLRIYHRILAWKAYRDGHAFYGRQRAVTRG